MNPDAPLVLIDACVLVKSAVRDIFLDLGQAGLIDLHWTPEIFAEYAKNWAKLRLRQFERSLLAQDQPKLPEVIRQKKSLELQATAWKQLDSLEKMIPEWPVPGWVDSKSADHPELRSLLGAGTTGGVDSKDLHVALAAFHLSVASASANDPSRETWLLTENLSDLPPPVLGRLGIWSVDQATALEALFELNPAETMASIEKTRSEWKRPTVSAHRMLDLLADPNQIGSKHLCRAMANFWQL